MLGCACMAGVALAPIPARMRRPPVAHASPPACPRPVLLPRSLLVQLRFYAASTGLSAEQHACQLALLGARAACLTMPLLLPYQAWLRCRCWLIFVLRLGIAWLGSLQPSSVGGACRWAPAASSCTARRIAAAAGAALVAAHCCRTLPVAVRSVACMSLAADSFAALHACRGKKLCCCIVMPRQAPLASFKTGCGACLVGWAPRRVR